MSIAKSASKPAKAKAGSAGRGKAWWSRYTASLRYAFHVITHPFDGFWDLIHEKKGTIAAANTFLFLFLPLFLALYYLTPFRFRSALILAGSYLFYGWWRFDFLALLILTTIWTYAIGHRVAARWRSGNCT